MKTIKGIVLEQNGSKCIVMGSDGSFKEIVNKTKAQVGEEIEIALNSGQNQNRFGLLRVWAGVAALFLLVFTATLGWNLWQASTAVALVSVDINPSLELTVNAQNKVLKVTAMNKDAQTILQGDSLKGQTVTEAMQKIVSKAIEYKFLSSDQAWIVVGLSPEGKASLQRSSELASPQIIKTVKEATKDKGLNPQVAVLTLSDQDRKNAEREGLTVGQYVLWQNANKAGLEVKPQGVKDKEARQRILDNPQVQEQLEKQKNVIKAHPMSKEMKDKQNGKDHKKDHLYPESKTDQDQSKDKGVEEGDFSHGKMEQELNDKEQGMAKKTGSEESKEKNEAQEDSDKQSSSKHSTQVWRNSSNEQTGMNLKAHSDKGNDDEENKLHGNERDQENQED